MDVAAYFCGDETTRRRELVWGVLREPPAPFYSHQRIVTRVAVALETHVRRRALGSVCVAPVDVVLDPRLGLVAQPDVVFISAERLDIIRNQIWGAPDLVVEVLSMGTTQYDRTVKLDWYRRYGVAEYWLIDPIAREVQVVDCRSQELAQQTFSEQDTLRSRILPRLRLRAARVFED
jgi:Uma2 family endonuclease